MEARVTLILEPRCRLGLIYFGDSHIETASGPLLLEIGESASTGEGAGHLRRVTYPRRGGTHDLMVDNLARMAGRADRGGPIAWLPTTTPEIAELSVAVDGQSLRTLSWRCVAPGGVRVEVARLGDDGPGPPRWSKPLEPAGAERCQIDYDGPPLPPANYVARVVIPQAGLMGERRFGLLSASEKTEWAQWRERIQGWAGEAPEDPVPWRVQAGIAMSFCERDEALDALIQARDRCRNEGSIQVVQAEVEELQRELGLR